ncbi:hypothetical protein QQF64_012317 [Cirrhinus molitorella]|uniref:Secreted protein n=1 Tax=Cirrhinus molitorella TaxID=172907 RepID=A0ABR3LV39_9TELE
MWNASWWQAAAFPTSALRPLWRSLTQCMKDPNKAALSLLSGPASTRSCRDRPQPALFFCGHDSAVKKQSRNKLLKPPLSFPALAMCCIVLEKPGAEISALDFHQKGC